MKKLVTVQIDCGQYDVPTFLRRMADFAESEKFETLMAEGYYEYSDEMGVAQFDYE